MRFVIIAFLASCLLAVIAAQAPSRHAEHGPEPHGIVRRVSVVGPYAGTNFSATPLLQ